VANFKLSRAALMAIAALIGVALIATVVYLSFGDSDDGDEESWQEGDYAEWAVYYYEYGGQPGDPAGYQRYTLTEVGPQWLTVNYTQFDMARDILYTHENHLPVNSTGFGYASIGISSIAYPVTDLGMDTVETEWGDLSAHHYRYSYNSSEITYTVDMWARNGFIVAMSTTANSGLQGLVILVDTNIEAVFAP
jgi:hypothetical protein